MATPPETPTPAIDPALALHAAQLIVESVADYAIFMLDPLGRVVTWNLGAEKIKGYAPSEIIGRHFSTFYPAIDVAQGKPEWELDVARREGRVEDEGWRVRKDGTEFWANVVITVVRDANGDVRGFAKVTRDLTEKRRDAEALRQADERFHQLVDAVTDYAIYVLDVSGHVLTWNEGAKRAKGYSASEIIGQHFSLFYTEEDRRAGKPALALETVQREGRFEASGWRVRKDGSRFWANVIVTPLRNEQGVLLGFAKVTRDLTARRQAEEIEKQLLREQMARAAAEESETKLRASEEAARAAARTAEVAARLAEESSRVKEEFLATVSHELRTPLNAIMGWSGMLRARSLEPSLKKGIDAIHRNAEAQARIIEDILDVSRIITGKLLLQLQSMDLVTIVNEALDVVRPSAVARGITLIFTPGMQEALLVGDPDRLRQVVWNLLSNAVKFSERDAGAISVEIEKSGSTLSLRVRDNGRGIAPGFLPHVFERFKQADGSSTRRFGGLGLGLALVRHIAELHGGTVRADSAGAGQGSLFTVTLPIRALVPSELPAAEVKPPVLDAGGEKKVLLSLTSLRVLVVDDDADARELVSDLLSGAGATVETAASAAAGYAALRSFKPGLLISDIGMADEDGYAFMRRVRALPNTDTLPSIALTAYAGTQDRQKAEAAGFTSHLAKPVNVDDLLAQVASLSGMDRPSE